MPDIAFCTIMILAYICLCTVILLLIAHYDAVQMRRFINKKFEEYYENETDDIYFNLLVWNKLFW